MTQDGMPKRLSPTSIDRWRQCPRSFYFQYVKRLHVAETYSFERQLGLIVHKALETLMRHQPSGRDEDAQLRTVEWAALRIAAAHRVGPDEMERLRREASTMVGEYLADPAVRDATPLKVEATFQLRLKNGVAVQTRVDRIDQSEAGVLEVIDYKTGFEQLDERDLGHETAPIVQLLAVSKASALPVQKVTWHYLRGGESISWWPEAEDVDAAADRLVERLRAIYRDQEFEPLTGVHCVTCPFVKICPAWPAGVDAQANGDVDDEPASESSDLGELDEAD